MRIFVFNCTGTNCKYLKKSKLILYKNASFKRFALINNQNILVEVELTEVLFSKYDILSSSTGIGQSIVNFFDTICIFANILKHYF